MMTKRVLMISLCLMTAVCQPVCSQSDLIVCLDGSVEKGTVTLVTDNQVLYTHDGTSHFVDRRNLYMVKFEGRGNMFALQNGTLSFDESSDNSVVPADAATIYMVWGQEIIARRAEVTGTEVTYETYEKKNSRHHALPMGDVFMVRYPNGTFIIVTPLTHVKVEASPPSKEQQLPVVIPVDAQLIKKTRPAEALITLQNGNAINANIIGGNDQVVTYYRKTTPKGPVYQLQRSQIASIDYKRNKKNKK